MMPAQNQTTTSKTPPRRPRGSGSEWQDQRGTWHARKEIAPNPRTGKRRMVEAQAPTKTAARQRLQEKIKRLQREGDMPLAGTPTLDEWMERWLNTIAPNVKPRTLETYRSDCNTIRSVIGGMRAGEAAEGFLVFAKMRKITRPFFSSVEGKQMDLEKIEQGVRMILELSLIHI